MYGWYNLLGQEGGSNYGETGHEFLGEFARGASEGRLRIHSSRNYVALMRIVTTDVYILNLPIGLLSGVPPPFFFYDAFEFMLYVHGVLRYERTFGIVSGPAWLSCRDGLLELTE